jgi:hypothetical protein
VLDRPIGAPLSRDIATGEKVEAELDAFVRGRDKERRKTEGERLEEEAWKESTRLHNAALEAEGKGAPGWRGSSIYARCTRHARTNTSG